MNTGMEQRF